MGRNRNSWYVHAQWIIKDYQKNKKELEAITADYAYAHSQLAEERVQCSNISGGAVDVVLKMEKDERRNTLLRDIAAVDYGLAMQGLYEDGDIRIAYITARYWSGMYTPDGAAASVHISPPTGQRINQQFVKDVAKKAGYLV